MRTTHLVIALAVAAALAGACSKGKDNANPTPEPANAAATDPAAARAMFNERCAACHGPNGDGKGTAAAALNPKPRNYHDTAWQASVTDEQIKKTIVYGGAAVGKSPIMPASPDLDAKPEVVEGLLKIIRRFGT